MAATAKNTLNVYMPNGQAILVKYMGATNVQTIIVLVVSKFVYSDKPYTRSYALYLHAKVSQGGLSTIIISLY